MQKSRQQQFKKSQSLSHWIQPLLTFAINMPLSDTVQLTGFNVTFAQDVPNSLKDIRFCQTLGQML